MTRSRAIKLHNDVIAHESDANMNQVQIHKTNLPSVTKINSCSVALCHCFHNH